MAETVHFLPWARSGLGLGLATRERERLAPLPRTATFDAYIEIDHTPYPTTLSLRPPDHAVAIETSQIARRYPEPGTPDAEYGYFPHVEFTACDLPWVLSPARADEESGDADSTGRLRPWLVLVCLPVELAALAQTTTRTGTTLTAPVVELPDLGESWAWAHVQSAVPAADMPDEAASASGAVVSRLLAPRELAPNRHYLVALVNAWRAGDDELLPAWEIGDGGDAVLDVHDTWTFSTGAVGSFEELARRLGPVDDADLEFGLHPVDLGTLGLSDPWSERQRPVRAYYRGAVADALSTDVLLSDDQADTFADTVQAIVEQGQVRQELDLSEPDPVVAPPCYGAFAVGAVTAAAGWMRELNVVPSRRFAAGLGARIVRRNQERLMATAWEQAGQIREANRVRGQALLRQSQGESWRHRNAELDPHQLFSVLGPQLSFVRVEDGRPVRRVLADSTLPNGVGTPAFQRAMRPSGVVARSLRAPLVRERLPGEEPIYGNRADMARHVRDTLQTPAGRAGLQLEIPRIPGGMRVADPARPGVGIGRPGGPIGLPGGIDPVPDVDLVDSVDLEAVRQEVLEAIQPGETARRQLLQRVPALAATAGHSVAAGVPGPARSGPVFTEPLSEELMAQSPELLMPGASEFPDNAVRLLEADPGFVAALLAGANHEMIRELVWREYPAALSHTAFSRFWARPDPEEYDIDPMAGWQYILPLDRLGAAGGESAILLVRGDLLRQYPAARFLLYDPGEDELHLPAFSGQLPPDTAFFGFDVPDTDVVTAPDSVWQLVIEEPPQEPRFGLDTGPAAAALESWADIAWSALQGHQGPHLSIDSGAHFNDVAALATEATWGLNGAHMAFATLQKPFRLRMNVADILGGD